MDVNEIGKNRYYSNGAYGKSWGVRLVSSLTDADEGATQVNFKGIAGACRRKTGHSTLAEFAKWAKYEVALNENSWQRIVGTETLSEPSSGLS